MEPVPPKTTPKKRTNRGCLLGVGLVGLGALFTCGPIFCAASDGPGIAGATVLELNLEGPMVEHTGGASVTALFKDEGDSLQGIVRALARARTDERVKALVVKIGGQGHGAATAQELRDAITAFRSSGKRAVCWSESFGEGSIGTGGYYVATACDEIWLLPSGDLSLAGLFAETPFLKGAFQKAGVAPVFLQRKEYKNAVNTFTHSDYDEPHREATTRLLEGITDQIAADIGAARKLEPARVKELMAEGPFNAQQAKEKGLVDQLGYRDEVMAALRQHAGEDMELLYARKYLERAGEPWDHGPTVALINAAGAIHRGASSVDPLSGDASVGSDTVSGAIRAAVLDPSVQAIVLRVNSPGGSYVASDAIWREVQRAREARKPFIVTMGDYAASGGYFIAMGADTVVAHPATLTGSIGVYSGKFVLTELLDKLGVNLSMISRTSNADIYSADSDYSPESRAKMDAAMDRIYADFVAKAAHGRKMSVEKLEALARGRVWIGADAKERGLVDELGGIETALRIAKQRANIADDQPIEVREYPRQKTKVEELLALTGRGQGDSSDDEGATSTMVAKLPPAVQRALAEISRAAKVDVLTAPVSGMQPLP